jgi:hypothetical protein
MQIGVEQQDRVGDGMDDILATKDRLVVTIDVPLRKRLQDSVNLLCFALEHQLLTQLSESTVESLARKVKVVHVVGHHTTIEGLGGSQIARDFLSLQKRLILVKASFGSLVCQILRSVLR